MAEGFGEMVIIYNLLPEFAAQLEETVSKVVRKTAFDIQALAQANAPVDTGFLKNSIYTVMEGHSGYSNIEPPEKEGQELLPEVEPPHEKAAAIVAVGANYGIYQEFGSSRMPAHPYLTPAAELVKPYFLEALSHLEEAMAANATGGGE